MRLNARLNAEQAAHLAGIQQQTNQSVSEIIRQALEMYYQAVCQRPVAAKEILSKNGFVGGFEADPELSTSYKTQLQQSLAEKHDPG